MADKLFGPWIKRKVIEFFLKKVIYDDTNIATEFFDSGLFLNGTFTTGIDNWARGSGTQSWNEELKSLQSNGYNIGYFKEDLPGNTNITVKFTVDVSLGGAAGYCDIYQRDSSGTNHNWKKVNYSVVDNVANVSYTYTTDSNISVSLMCNFNHDKMCTVKNVSCFIN